MKYIQLILKAVVSKQWMEAFSLTNSSLSLVVMINTLIKMSAEKYNAFIEIDADFFPEEENEDLNEDK